VAASLLVSGSLAACGGGDTASTPTPNVPSGVSSLASDAASNAASAAASASAAVGAAAQLPASWPTDIPTPTGLSLLRVIPSPTTANGKIAIYYGEGDLAAVSSQMTSGLTSAGYSEVSNKEVGPMMISTWKKKDTNVSLNINAAAGKVTCSVSANPLS